MADAYSTISRLLPSGSPSWASPLDQRRISSYSVYEDIYWGSPDTFRVVQRGDDQRPIYIPSGRQIIETMNRHLAPGMTFVPDPTLGTPAEQQTLFEAWTLFTRRERFASRFGMNKRYGLIRGDWLFHITADPRRPQGSRLSLLPLDPSMYFPIYDPDDIETVIGCHIAEQWLDSEGKPFIYRLTYMKETESGGPSPIVRSEGIFKPDSDWQDYANATPERQITPWERLPEPISAIPVYHIKNLGDPSFPFGSSEMRGLESMMAGINQAISDEELELALNGLGVYATDGGTPIDEDTGEPVGWDLGPGRVVELPDGKTFRRVSGTSTVTPYQEHIRYLQSQVDGTLGISDAAKGSASVEVAESGIALAIRMGPIFSRAEEQELGITDVMLNMAWDWKAWMRAYEGVSFGESAALVPVYGDRMPLNKSERIKEVLSLVGAGVVSLTWAMGQLSNLGFEIGDPADMLAQIIAEKQALGEAEVDPFGSRITTELNDGTA